MKYGFCIIPIKDTDIVDNLENKLNSLKIISKDDLYVSNYSNYELNKEIFDSISNIANRELAQHFLEFKTVTAHFLIKKPYTNAGLQLHQDWSTTDELNWKSAHVWIPHQDTTIANGAMYAIPSSHVFFRNYRSGSLGIPRIKKNIIISALSRPIIIKKGEMLIFNLSLFHGSYPNMTSIPRHATIIHIMESMAPLRYYHLENNKIQILSITPETYLKNVFAMQKGNQPTASTFVDSIVKSTVKSNHKINTLSILYAFFKNKIIQAICKLSM